MSLKGEDQIPGRRIPELHRFVGAAREHPRPVEHERDRLDTLVSFLVSDTAKN
jgi:hypothetical protein